MSPRRRPVSEDEAAENSAFLQAVGAVLRRRRQARGLTLFEVGVRAQVQPSHVGGIETGDKNPTVVTLWRVSAELDVTLHEVFDEAGF